MASARPGLTHNILRACYSQVRTLGDYLTLISGQGTDATRRDLLTHETDTLRYRQLLRNTVVATESNPKSYKTAQPVGCLREVVEQAQLTLLKSRSSCKNLLVAGYRLGGGHKNSGTKSLINYFINTLISIFEAPEWNVLYERVGVDIIMHLLTETSIFVQLPNECFCQVTGEPLITLNIATDTLALSQSNIPVLEPIRADQSCQLKRKRDDNKPSERPRKRLRTTSSNASISKGFEANIEKTPVQIPISRLRLFYRRPDRANGTTKITFGLPLKHVLNLLASPRTKSGPQIPLDPRHAAATARHLSKHIFPRQYGLPSPFTNAEKDQLSSDFSDKEAQIKAKGNCKTPKRLKSTLELLEKLIYRHSKYGYRQLLFKICPSKIGIDTSGSLDETIILEMMLEDSSILISQSKVPPTSFDSEGYTVLPCGLSQARAQVKNKPRFAEFMCSYAEVFRFVAVVTEAVIPMAFWGSKRNLNLIMNHVKTFIGMRRYETFTLHSILQGFCTSDCDWLVLSTPGAANQSHVSVTDSSKRLELVQEFLFWYFDSFVIPLIRTNFYVTESSAFRNKVLYFRQDDWDTLCKPLVERLCAKTFQKLTQQDAEQILRQRRLGFSFVRLLPKDTGVRPIVNLKRKKSGTDGQYAQSINQIMSAAFHILTYEKESQKHLLGASVFGQNEIYTKLKGFKAGLMERSFNGKLPKLYFVKVDVQACFDTIEQSKLLEILRKIISEDEYSIQRHGQVCSVAGKIKRTFVKKGIPADDQPHFLKTAHMLAEALRHVIFVDQVLYPSAKRQEVLQLLEQHITDNIVKIGNSYYRQVIGIPQGSILSSLLCSFFYGDLERNHLNFTDDMNSILCRLIDDYLFVTTNLSHARQFLRVMSKGHPQYGSFISPDKTLTNFEDETIPNIVDLDQRTFPWCGFLIDMLDLSVSIDYSRFHETYLQDSLTVNAGRKPGSCFVQKMLQLAKSRSHIIFTDPELNSPHIIYRNIYENFLVTAMKMHYYLQSWKMDVETSSAFLTSTIRQMIRYAYSTMRNKATNKVALASGGKCETQKSAVLWLGAHAFHTALSCKSHAYQSVLRSLEFDMSLPQYRRLRKRLKRAIKEGRGLLTTLSF